MIKKSNTYKRKKETKNETEKRISYIHLKYNLDQVLKEIRNNKSKK